MLKILKFFVPIFFISIFICCSKKDTIETDRNGGFIKFFGGSAEDFAYDIKQTSDLGYVLVGTTTSQKTKADILLVKTDKYGNQIWEKTFGDTLNDIGKSIKISKDDGFILVGTYTKKDNYTEVFMIKTDKDGKVEWDNKSNEVLKTQWSIKTGNECFKTGESVQLTSDGGYIMTGSTTQKNDGNGNPEGKKDILMVKVDKDGNIEWVKSHGGAMDETGNQILQKADGGYIIVGQTESFQEAGQARTNAIVVETNSYGVQTDKLTYGGLEYDDGRSIIQTNDSYIFVGSTLSSGNGLSDVFLVCIEKKIHTIKWQKSFGGTQLDYGQSICLNSNNELVIIGSTASFGNGNNDIYFLKVDMNGNFIESKTFGNNGGEDGYSISQTFDGGYIIGGVSEFEKNSMATMIKIRSNGEID
jgi:hypothetical protein